METDGNIRGRREFLKDLPCNFLLGLGGQWGHPRSLGTLRHMAVKKLSLTVVVSANLSF